MKPRALLWLLLLAVGGSLIIIDLSCSPISGRRPGDTAPTTAGTGTVVPSGTTVPPGATVPPGTTVVSGVPSTTSPAVATNQSQVHTVTFKVPRTPINTDITYRYGTTEKTARCGGYWEETVSANNGDRLWISCTRPASAAGSSLPTTVQIIVDGLVAKEASNLAPIVSCEIERLPYIADAPTPTPSREELEQRIRDLEQRQAQEEARRPADGTPALDATNSSQPQPTSKQEQLDYQNHLLADLEKQRDELTRSLTNNPSPAEVQKQIDQVNREIDNLKRRIATTAAT